jgi:hypothetical protein
MEPAARFDRYNVSMPIRTSGLRTSSSGTSLESGSEKEFILLGGFSHSRRRREGSASLMYLVTGNVP